MLVGNSVSIDRTPFRTIRIKNNKLEEAIQPLVLLDSLLPPVWSTLENGRTSCCPRLMWTSFLDVRMRLLFFSLNNLYTKFCLKTVCSCCWGWWKIASIYNSLHRYTNPCELEINGYRLLVCSDYIIEELRRQLDGETDTMSIMKHMLTWCLTPPSVPNTCGIQHW